MGGQDRDESGVGRKSLHMTDDVRFRVVVEGIRAKKRGHRTMMQVLSDRRGLRRGWLAMLRQVGCLAWCCGACLGNGSAGREGGVGPAPKMTQ